MNAHLAYVEIEGLVSQTLNLHPVLEANLPAVVLFLFLSATLMEGTLALVLPDECDTVSEHIIDAVHQISVKPSRLVILITTVIAERPVIERRDDGVVAVGLGRGHRDRVTPNVPICQPLI